MIIVHTRFEVVVTGNTNLGLVFRLVTSSHQRARVPMGPAVGQAGFGEEPQGVEGIVRERMQLWRARWYIAEGGRIGGRW